MSKKPKVGSFRLPLRIFLRLTYPRRLACLATRRRPEYRHLRRTKLRICTERGRARHSPPPRSLVITVPDLSAGSPFVSLIYRGNSALFPSRRGRRMPTVHLLRGLAPDLRTCQWPTDIGRRAVAPVVGSSPPDAARTDMFVVQGREMFVHLGLQRQISRIDTFESASTRGQRCPRIRF
ncbi:hypothetical protein F5X68DRAFT_55298 [Plectosphaerella plurivora]|uniref:Uncharacterized protein n=1 Tax=Plectosphaerella plurivora TaxID=936078 RepID=A0A9P8V2M5_9PEZI|nr:hypothetical protein F5X68DRAFT_55298 [Plectosphaerella plurivora]